MKVNKANFRRLLKDGYATFFANEVKLGYLWKLHLDNMLTFNRTINRISMETKRNPQNTTRDMLYRHQLIQDHKNLVWMEGTKGWITWVDTFDEVLH